ncbi:MAG: alanine--glyoxylate aminotransferase, partial [Gammaproteobacteria bacterium]
MHVPNQIADALQHLYGLQVRSAHRLEGEVDHNYLLQTDRGPFLAKCTPPPADTEAIDFQIALMEHLAGRLEQIETPRVVRGLDGRNWYRLPDGQVLRLQTWVAGRMLAEVRPRTMALLEQWGRVAGLLNAALADFDYPYAHRAYRWDPSRTLNSRPLARFFRTDEERALADWFWQLFEREAAPVLPRLRQGVNYNDAHEHNLLVSGEVCHPRISGVIDFGDSLHTHTVNELAIACAYACMGMAD